LTQSEQMFDFRAADFAIFNPAESWGADADNTFQIPERQPLSFPLLFDGLAEFLAVQRDLQTILQFLALLVHRLIPSFSGALKVGGE
jgi:hypothetical protein